MRSLSQSLQVWISPRPAKSSKRISSQNKKTSSCLAKGNRVPQVNDSPLDIHQSFIPADMLTTTTIGSNEGHGEKDYFNFSPSSNQGGTLTPASQTHVSVYSLEHKQSFQDASPISAGPGASSDEDRDYRDAIQQWDHEQAIERKPSLPVISDIKAKICSPLPRLPVRKRPSLADAQLINEVVNSVCLINSMLLLGKNKASVTMSLNTLKRRPSLGLTTSSRLVTPDEVFRLPLVHGLLPNQASRPPVFNLEVALSAQKLYPRRPQCPFK